MLKGRQFQEQPNPLIEGLGKYRIGERHCKKNILKYLLNRFYLIIWTIITNYK